MKKIKYLISIITLLCLTGCFKDSVMNDITISTSVYPIQYIVDTLYGEHSTISSIYPNDSEIKDFEVTNILLDNYSNNDLFIFNGLSKEKEYVRYMLKNNKELIQSLLSPIINNISFDGKDTFKIYSNDCGNFSFGLAANYFQNNPEILKYMEENQLNNYCHQHTEKLAKIYPQYVSITSLCHNYFVDGFYHSYTYNPDDKKIIDLCKKIVMDKEEYDCLQGAKEISFIPNSEIKKAYRQTLRKTIQPKRRYMIFKIALYNQLKNLTEEEATLIKSYKKINR